MHTQETHHQETVGERGKPKLQLARGQLGGLRRVGWEGVGGTPGSHTAGPL